MIEGDHHLYEVIRTDVPRFSYFDIEGSYQSVKRQYNHDDMDDIETDVIKDLTVVLAEIKSKNELNELQNLVILSASNNAKLSLHVIDRGIGLTDKGDCKAYHDAFLHSIRNQP